MCFVIGFFIIGFILVTAMYVNDYNNRPTCTKCWRRKAYPNRDWCEECLDGFHIK